MNPIVNDAEIEQAVILLQQGKLVAFPTETVYGLGADASNPQAIMRLFKAKERPINRPVAVLLACQDQLSDWAQEINPVVRQLAQHFWPGPLTLILPCAAHVSPVLTAGQTTIGLRVPNHPLTQRLLKAFGKGIAATSANRSGQISPTQAAQVSQELGDAVDLVLNGGTCTIGIESTIVDCSREQPCIIRLGALAASEISQVTGQSIAVKIVEKRSL